MRALRIHRYGGPEVLKYEVALQPAPGAGGVLIRVHAAGVSPLDWKVREGCVNEFVSIYRAASPRARSTPAAFLCGAVDSKLTSGLR